jgi:predicted nucleotide-binding protein
LEAYGALVGYAIILMTPDDVGRKDDPDNDEQKRARQNVIFEAGYFMGKLGRGRVCVLVKDDVEFPSDLRGVVYIEVGDDDKWKKQLLDEMQPVVNIEPRRYARALGLGD